jgi:hypothetical protein
MTRRRIVLSVLALVLVLATIHAGLHGLPALSSFNPHSR